MLPEGALHRRHAVILALLTVAVHAPLLVNDSLLYNSLRINAAIEDHDLARLLFHYKQIGFPWGAYFYWGIGQLPAHVHVFKILALACLIAAAISIFWLARWARVLGEPEALAVALISIAYPAYPMWGEMIMLPYTLAYAQFFFGCVAYAKYVDDPSAKSGWLWLAFLMFVMAFTIPSFLVFFYGVMAFFFVIDGGLVRPYPQSILAWTRRHLAALLLPPVFFALFSLARVKPTGRYVHYN
jgi:hypothetical protein